MDCHGTCESCQAEKAAWERVARPLDEYQTRRRGSPTQTAGDARKAREKRRHRAKTARRARKAQRRRG